MVPEEWRVVRGMLKALALILLVGATVSTLSDPIWARGPLPVALGLYVASPLVVAALALVGARRWPGARVPMRLVAATSTVVFLANLGLTVMAKHLGDELHGAMGRSCKTLTKCRTLVTEKFPNEHPLVPTTRVVGGFEFDDGEESGRLLGYWYRAEKAEVPTLVFLITERRRDGFEPPESDSAYVRTPRGRRVVEGRDEKGVRRLDFWDERFHYAVSLQGAYEPSSIEYLRAVTLVDDARPI